MEMSCISELPPKKGDEPSLSEHLKPRELNKRTPRPYSKKYTLFFLGGVTIVIVRYTPKTASFAPDCRDLPQRRAIPKWPERRSDWPGYRCLGFRVSALGFRVQVLGCRV